MLAHACTQTQVHADVFAAFKMSWKGTVQSGGERGEPFCTYRNWLDLVELQAVQRN